MVFCANPSLRRSRDTLIYSLKGAQIAPALLADLGLCGFSFGLGPNKKSKTEVCATAGLRIAMGHDGLKGCEALANQNAPIIVQDEAASVAWGMPGLSHAPAWPKKFFRSTRLERKYPVEPGSNPPCHPAY